MSRECLKCDADISELVGWNTIPSDYVECPICSHKMVIEYEEYWDGVNEYGFWSILNYTDGNIEKK